MVVIRRYHELFKPVWDQFCALAANSTFLHQRNYMDYHSDRFTDHSLLFYEQEKLIAVLPCNEKEHCLHSHAGLTYGGLLTHHGTKTAHILAVFTALLRYLRENNLDGLYYKPVPTIFHRHRLESDLYALSQNKALLAGRDISSAIYLRGYRLPSKKMGGVRKALNSGIEIITSTDFNSFFDIVNDGLQAKYGAMATHTADEMKTLHTFFPDNIILQLAMLNNRILGGALLYACGPTLHAQYIGQTDTGMKHRCLDLLINHITSTFTQFEWFNFGISSERKGQHTNIGLLNSKEEFMTSSLCFDYYYLAANPDHSAQDH